MIKENNIPEEQKEAVLSVIQKLRDGTLSGESLDKETRLECINALRLEGYTIPQMAQVLKLSDRTIKRYVKELKEHNALETDDNFAKEFLGDLMQKVSNSFNYLLRLSRNKETTMADKIQAEVAACRLLFDSAKLLQSTGHLPLEPQLFGADVYHHMNNFTEQDIVDIETAAKGSIGLPENLSKMLGDLRAQAEKAPEQEKEKDNEPESVQ